MASNQLSNKRGRQGGQSAQSGSRAESGSHADFGTLSRDVREKAEGYLEQGREQVRELTRDHEGTAVAVALAAGFGIGLAIGCALASTSQRPRTWRNRMSAEGIGRHMLDRLEGMIPDALADYIRK
jgi:hypothetical protein